MEKDVTKFLKQIVSTISAGLVWALVNMTAGIFAGWMFYTDRPTTGNIIFYVWLALSFTALIWYIYKTWKDDF